MATRTSVALEAYELLLTKPLSDSAAAAESSARAAARSRQGTASGGPAEHGSASESAGDAGVIMSATCLLLRQQVGGLASTVSAHPYILCVTLIYPEPSPQAPPAAFTSPKQAANAEAIAAAVTGQLPSR